MKRQSRETLRSYFREGGRPTEDQFSDLIESMLNINDEGFNKTKADGLRITSLGDSKALASFYHPNSADNRAEWAVGFGTGREQLVFRRPSLADLGPENDRPPPVLALDAAGFIGVNVHSPREALDVAGTVRASGRMGDTVEVIANGRWQPLTGELRGCHAFEVVAGVGQRHTGRFALMHAIALNTFNPIWWDAFFGRKRRIRATHAFYSHLADRVQLRWQPLSKDPTRAHGDGAVYRLMIRTRRDYMARERLGGKLLPSEEVHFRAHVTQLWFDDMTTDYKPE